MLDCIDDKQMSESGESSTAAANKKKNARKKAAAAAKKAATSTPSVTATTTAAAATPAEPVAAADGEEETKGLSAEGVATINEVVAAAGGSSASSRAALRNIASAVPGGAAGLEELLMGFAGRKKPKEQKPHKFWPGQPMMKMAEAAAVETDGPIEQKELKDISTDPYPLPSKYQWVSCDLKDEKVMEEVYVLLRDHYVEDDDNKFRFDYSKALIAWALMVPDYKVDWHVGVRRISDGTLMAFITGTPAHFRILKKHINGSEVNFLCVHKSLRDQRLAPVLIKEVTRRINLTGVWQAGYTIGKVVPTPISQARYYHRSLNAKKLVEIGFSGLPPRHTMSMHMKLHKLADRPKTPRLRPLTAADCPHVLPLLTKHLNKFDYVPEFSAAEFEHFFVPRDKVVYSFVVENEAKKITDFISFYALHSTVIGNTKYPSLNAVYSFYNACTKTKLQDLMADALILARDLGYDVFNCLDLMDNKPFLEPLKFNIGTHSIPCNLPCMRYVMHE